MYVQFGIITILLSSQSCTSQGWPAWPEWPEWPASDWPEWPEWPPYKSSSQNSVPSPAPSPSPPPPSVPAPSLELTEAAVTQPITPQVSDGFSTVSAALQSREDVLDFLLIANSVDFSEYFDDPNFVATIFVPTNQALEAALDTLAFTPLNSDSALEFLLGLIEYHVIDNVALKAEDLQDGQVLNTQFNNVMNVIVEVDGGVAIQAVDSKANVVEADIQGGQSIIHIIDTVLLPLDAQITREVNEALKIFGTQEFPTTMDALSRIPSLSSISTAIQVVDLAESLNSPNFAGTLFAPSNAAFEKAVELLGLDSVDQLLRDRLLLDQLIQYHCVFDDQLFLHQFEDGMEIKTIQGQTLAVDTEEFVKIISEGSEATIIEFNVVAGNVVIHVVDTILLPSDVETIGEAFQVDSLVDESSIVITTSDQVKDFSTFIEFLESRSELSLFYEAARATTLLQEIDVENDINTIFVPTNGALIRGAVALGFDSLDQLIAETDYMLGILEYHIVPDQAVRSFSMLDGMDFGTVLNEVMNLVVYVDEIGNVEVTSVGSTATVIEPDVTIGRLSIQSIIHVIDEALLPVDPVIESQINEAIMTFYQDEFDSVDQVVSNLISTSSFLTAVEDAGLGALIQLSDYVGTVFVPTNEAFEKLNDYLQENRPELITDLTAFIDTWQQILEYHFVTGKYYLSQFFDGQQLESLLQGKILTVDDDEDFLRIQGEASTAQVIDFNVDAGETVVHFIDEVLLPFEL